MKRMLASALFIAAITAATARPVHAVVEGHTVVLVASTVAGGPLLGAPGNIETALPDALLFHAKGQPDLQIPYARITAFEHQERKTHRLGFLPALAAGLVAARLHDHFLIVTFHDATDKVQVVRFEVSKEEGENLLAVLGPKTGASSGAGSGSTPSTRFSSPQGTVRTPATEHRATLPAQQSPGDLFAPLKSEAVSQTVTTKTASL